jgi:hypothetical protein
MASLLERMNLDPAEGVGPVRSKARRAGSAPYTRPPKADINSPWKHDMYRQGAEPGKSLSDRLDAPSRDNPPKMNFGGAVKALKDATGLGPDKELSIRGASTRGNVVEVTGLVKGTTAEDVEVSNGEIRLFVMRRVGYMDISPASSLPWGLFIHRNWSYLELRNGFCSGLTQRFTFPLFKPRY